MSTTHTRISSVAEAAVATEEEIELSLAALDSSFWTCGRPSRRRCRGAARSPSRPPNAAVGSNPSALPPRAPLKSPLPPSNASTSTTVTVVVKPPAWVKVSDGETEDSKVSSLVAQRSPAAVPGAIGESPIPAPQESAEGPGVEQPPPLCSSAQPTRVADKAAARETAKPSSNPANNSSSCGGDGSGNSAAVATLGDATRSDFREARGKAGHSPDSTTPPLLDFFASGKRFTPTLMTAGMRPAKQCYPSASRVFQLPQSATVASAENVLSSPSLCVSPPQSSALLFFAAGDESGDSASTSTKHPFSFTFSVEESGATRDTPRTTQVTTPVPEVETSSSSGTVVSTVSSNGQAARGTERTGSTAQPVSPELPISSAEAPQNEQASPQRTLSPPDTGARNGEMLAAFQPSSFAATLLTSQPTSEGTSPTRISTAGAATALETAPAVPSVVREAQQATEDTAPEEAISTVQAPPATTKSTTTAPLETPAAATASAAAALALARQQMSHVPRRTPSQQTLPLQSKDDSAPREATLAFPDTALASPPSQIPPAAVSASLTSPSPATPATSTASARSRLSRVPSTVQSKANTTDSVRVDKTMEVTSSSSLSPEQGNEESVVRLREASPPRLSAVERQSPFSVEKTASPETAFAAQFVKPASALAATAVLPEQVAADAASTSAPVPHPAAELSPCVSSSSIPSAAPLAALPESTRVLPIRSQNTPFLRMTTMERFY